MVKLTHRQRVLIRVVAGRTRGLTPIAKHMSSIYSKLGGLDFVDADTSNELMGDVVAIDLVPGTAMPSDDKLASQPVVEGFTRDESFAIHVIAGSSINGSDVRHTLDDLFHKTNARPWITASGYMPGYKLAISDFSHPIFNEDTTVTDQTQTQILTLTNSPFKLGEIYNDSEGGQRQIIGIGTDNTLFAVTLTSSGGLARRYDANGKRIGSSDRLLPPAPPKPALVDILNADTSAVASLIKANARTNTNKVVTVRTIRETIPGTGLLAATAAYDYYKDNADA